LRELTRLLYIEMPHNTIAARITSVMIVPTSKLLPDSEPARIRRRGALRHVQATLLSALAIS
jgi:hypothetical protein